MTRTSIEWATDSWNPIAAYDKETGKRGWFCTKVSPGCTNCYAEKINKRLGNGHLYRVGNLGKVRFELTPTLNDPLHWRKPRRVFVNSMTDLFLEAHTDEMIDEVFSVMGGAPDHEFLVLTKRPERQRDYMKTRAYRAWNSRRMEMEAFPPRNVWLGVSVENQQAADERIPILLDTPAAIRFLSCEPLLGEVQIPEYLRNPLWNDVPSWQQPVIDWVIVGGESGSDARRCNIAWIRYLLAQCQRAQCPVFVKQLGKSPVELSAGIVTWPEIDLLDKKGGDMAEWPADLRVREFPGEAALV